MSDNTRFWEKGYSDPNVWTMGGPSVEVYEIEQLLPENSSVLDIGCGEGRNAIFMAFRGHKVTALELSSSAVKKLRMVAEKFSLDIQVIEGRIEDFVPDPGQQYDLVLAHSSLHFVDKEIWVPLVAELRKLTNRGGFHNFTSIIGTAKYPVPHECRHANSFSRGDLDNMYSSWQAVRSDFYAKWDTHPGIPMHVHVVEKFVARFVDPTEKPAYTKTTPTSNTDLPEAEFLKIPLKLSDAEVRKLGIESDMVHRTEIPGINLISPGEETESYTIEDWIFENRGLQFTQGVLTGKYEYFTPPTYLSI